MQVTLRQREQFDGTCNVDCRIDFSQEETAIVVTRRLGSQYSLVLPAAIPLGSGISPSGLGAGFLKFIGWVGVILGGLMICSSFGAIAAHDAAGFFLILFGMLIGGAGVAAFVVRSREGARYDSSLEDQAVSLTQLMSNPVFTVHAPTRDLGMVYANEIRTQLTLLKDGIMRHAEHTAIETFEI